MTESSDEIGRMKELIRLAILDTTEEREYDDITSVACTVCGTPIALISLIDQDRQWFKSRQGLPVRETHRDLAFCAHAIQTPSQVMVVHDAREDPRFAGNALVTGEPNIRFYAGAPLVTSNNHAIGTLCVIDRSPRELTDSQLEYLTFLAKEIVTMLEARVAPQQGAPH